jgi:hypothetical protein
MKLLFVAYFQEGNFTGEEPDEIHMTRCLRAAGADVTVCPRDEVRDFYSGGKTGNIPPPGRYDVLLLGKVRYFDEAVLADLRARYAAPIVYWVWDMLRYYHLPEFPEGWCEPHHLTLLRHSDLYLSGELGLAPWFAAQGVRHRYFNWDTADGAYDAEAERTEDLDVVFPGTFVSFSHRTRLLRAVRERFRLTVFGSDFEIWRREGFEAEPGLYGGDFRRISSRAKVVLVMNACERRAETSGYWSNRIGKIVTTGGFPLVHYVPMMERSFGDHVAYFHDEADLIERIGHWLDHPAEREALRARAYRWGRREMTTEVRMRELVILLEDFVRSGQAARALCGSAR